MPLLGHRKESPDHSELWLVSYADMMTLLLGFFIILYSLSHLDQRKFYVMGKQVAESFNKQEKALKGAEGNLERREARSIALLVELLGISGGEEALVNAVEREASEKSAMDSARSKLEMAPEEKQALEVVKKMKGSLNIAAQEIKFIVPDNALFKPGTATLSPKARDTFKEIANYLSQAKQLAEVEVSGHTDSSPLGSKGLFNNNFSLSSARAGAVAEELIKNGLSASLISVRGMADLRPLYPEVGRDGKRDTANMAKNRRVEIVLKKRSLEPP